MKRVGMFVAVGALVVGLALPAMAQPPAPTFTVTFGGEMRTIGYASDNVSDYTDSTAGATRDSNKFLLQRFRLFTTVESADKKARIIWGLEIGDILWGAGGGSSGTEYGGTGGGGSVAKGGGGEVGADGVNVETKRLLTQFAIPGIDNTTLTIGIQNINFLVAAGTNFFGDDASAIKLNWRGDPIDVEVYAAKVTEGSRVNADDNNLYAAKIGVSLTKDLRFTVEGLIVDANCFARQAGPPAPALVPAAGAAVGAPATTVAGPASAGACIGSSFGDNRWVGATVSAGLGGVRLSGSFVYGARNLSGPPNDFTEEGYGANLRADVALGPVNTTWYGWYASGDGTRAPQTATNAGLTADSDRLPIPFAGDSWGSPRYIADIITGGNSVEQFGNGSPFDENPGGLYGFGGAATFAAAPGLTVGGGVGYVGATDAPGTFGDWALEIDAGADYQVNSNLRLRVFAGYVIPDLGDEAWAVALLSFFTF